MSGGGEPAPDAAALAARLIAWDRSPAAAEALRAEVRAHPDVRIRGTPPLGVRALAKAVELYRSADRGPKALGAWLLKDRNADEAAAFAPLIGDPAMGAWPFDEPFGLPEPDVVAWAGILRVLRPVVDPRIRRFLGVSFQVRRRQTWPAACRAWAALALDDAELRDALAKLWAACFGPLSSGKVTRWPKTGLAQAQGHHGAHLARHTLFLGACWRSVGGDPALAGMDPERLAGMPLPADDADRSVVLAALTELTDGSPDVGQAIGPLLVGRVAELGSDELSEAAFRELYARMPEGAPRDAVRKGLLEPRWTPARADTLWEWLNTARFFHQRGDADAVARMHAVAGEAEQALRWRIGDGLPIEPVEGLVAALIERLGRLLDPDRLAVVPVRRRAALLAETRLLMQTDDIQALPWPSLVRGAHPASGSETLSGTVAEVGEPSLCVLLAERALTSRTLMRDVVLDPANVLRIGNIQDGFVAGQVAVQAERILRELPGPSDQVRFLWNLLQRDPPYKTFSELALVLRTEVAVPGSEPTEAAVHPLRPMVLAVSALDQRRDEGAGVEVIAHAFAELVSSTCALLGEDQAGTALDGLAQDLLAAIEHQGDALDDPTWFARLQRVVLGNDAQVGGRPAAGSGPHGGLVSWAWWLTDNAPELAKLDQKRALTVKALSRLGAAARMVLSARPGVTAEHHEELCAASAALQDQIGPLGWPETLLVDALMQRLRAGSQEALAEGRRSRAAVEAVNRVLERGDEKALAMIIRDPDQLRLMPVVELRRIHSELLGQLRFADAEYLRRAVADRLRLPSRVAHLMPLFGAMAAGVFLVLDLGDAWLALVEKRAWPQYTVTVVFALAASYGLLLNDLAPRVAAGTGLRWLKLAMRALPTFLHAWTVSVAVSLLAMATLGLVHETVDGLLSLLLWSALALFLGVFIGLISQGQSATRRGGDG